LSLRGTDESCNDASLKLSGYVRIYNAVIDDDRMCLCGMLAAEYATLLDSIRDRVRRFFEANERWLAAVLLHGRETKQLIFQGSPIENARLLVSVLERATLVVRAHGDPARFRSTAARALAGFGVKLRKRSS
jgi:TetR/AcrR family transcriptional regulator, transcriptional repressor for nem operon